MAKSAFAIAHKILETANCLLEGESANLGCCVGFDNKQITTRGQVPWGVTRTDGKKGEVLCLAKVGEVPAKVGAPIIAKNTPLTTDAMGRLVPAASGENVFARAMGTAKMADEFILIEITREGRVA